MRLGVVSTLLLVGTLVLLAPISVAAQERSGLWGGIGGGYGAADVSSDEIGGGDREGSGVGSSPSRSTEPRAPRARSAGTQYDQGFLSVCHSLH